MSEGSREAHPIKEARATGVGTDAREDREREAEAESARDAIFLSTMLLLAWAGAGGLVVLAKKYLPRVLPTFPIQDTGMPYFVHLRPRTEAQAGWLLVVVGWTDFQGSLAGLIPWAVALAAIAYGFKRLVRG